MSVESFAREYDITADRVRAAMAYAQAFSDEIASDREYAEANQKWIETLDAVARGHKAAGGYHKGKQKASR